MAFQERLNLNNFVPEDFIEKTWLTRSTVDPLHTFDESGRPRLSSADGPFLPRWQTSPVLQTSLVNENLFEDPKVSQTARDCIASKSAVLGGFVSSPPGSTTHPDRTTSLFATLKSIWDGKKVEYLGDPMSNLVVPIFDKLSGTDRVVVGVLKSTIHWRAYLMNILPGTIRAITVVMENACDGNFTYELRGEDVEVLGEGDRHDRAFDEFEVVGRFRTDTIDDGTSTGIPLNQEGCPYTFHVYPTQQAKDFQTTNDPLIVSLAVAAVFLFTLGMFFFYNHLVERRQKLILAKATQSTAIVSSLFVSDSFRSDDLVTNKGCCSTVAVFCTYSPNKFGIACWLWRRTRRKVTQWWLLFIDSRHF